MDVFLRGRELFELLGVSPPEAAPSTQPEGRTPNSDIKIYTTCNDVQYSF